MKDIMTCPSCEGKKTVMSMGNMGNVNCPDCKGVGYIEKEGEKELTGSAYDVVYGTTELPEFEIQSPKKQRGRPKAKGK